MGSARDLRLKLDTKHQGLGIDIMDEGSPDGNKGLVVHDFSRNGLFVESKPSVAMSPGRQFHFAMDLGEAQELRGVGVVRWARRETEDPSRPRGYGVELLEFHDNSQSKYFSFMEDVILATQVADVMAERFESVFPDSSMRSAAEIMKRTGVEALLVTDSLHAPIGILTAQHIAVGCLQPDFFDQPVTRYMTEDMAFLKPGQLLDSIYPVIRANDHRFLPVVDDQTLVGLISTNGILPYLHEHQQLMVKRLGESFERAVSVIAHDLRSPIGVVHTANALLTSGEMQLNEFVEAGLPEIVESNCQSVLDLVDDILDVNQIKSGVVRLKKDLVSIEELLRSTVRCFSPTAQARGIAIECQIDQAVPKIKADQKRLEQVLNNLISNALKFSPPESKVTLGAKAQHSQVAIWVGDEGPGISQEVRESLFEEFSSLDVSPNRRQQKGHGLGLAIARRLVEAHGGSLRVDSEPGRGAVFTVFLPILSLQ